MDYAEDASRYADFYDRLAIDQALSRIAAGASTGPSAENCEQCDDPIPTARRAAEPGCTLCVACKTAQEQQRP